MEGWLSGFVKALSIISEEGRLTGLAYCLGLAQSALTMPRNTAEASSVSLKVSLTTRNRLLIADMEARTQAVERCFMKRRAAAGMHLTSKDMPNLLKFYISDCTMQTTIDAVRCWVAMAI